MKRKRRNKTSLILIVVFVVTFMLSFLTIFVNAANGSSSNTTNFSLYELKVKEATDDFYVNDFAGVFTKEQKEDLMSKAIKVDEEYSGIQVVITTVETLDSALENESSINVKNVNIEEVAYSMFNQYEIGEDDMGVLVLFSTGDRKVRIETGKKMQVYITDSISGRILDNYGMEYFRNDKFAEGLVSIQEGIISEIQSRVLSNWKDKELAESNKASTVKTNKNDLTEEIIPSKDTSSIFLDKELLRFIGLIFIIVGLIMKIISLSLKNKNMKHELDTYKTEKEKDIKYQKENFEQKIKDVENKSKERIKTKELIISKLRNEMSEKNQRIKYLNRTLEAQIDKFERAQKLHPEFNLENEILEMIESEYKEIAYEANEKLAQVLKLEANKDNIEIFKQAILLYEKSMPEVKKYIVSDINKIHELYDNSVILKKEFERVEQEKKDKKVAKDMFLEIKSIFTRYSKWDHSNYDTLNAAYFKFTSLTDAQKKFFPDKSLIIEIEKELITSKRDYKDFKTAQNTKEEIKSIVNSIYFADENDLNNLESAMKRYNRLSASQKAYFPDDLLDELKEKTLNAESDYRQKERMRRQRELQASSKSTSNTHQNLSSARHDSYSGRGGRPSGGGASRGF